MGYSTVLRSSTLIRSDRKVLAGSACPKIILRVVGIEDPVNLVRSSSGVDEAIPWKSIDARNSNEDRNSDQLTTNPL